MTMSKLKKIYTFLFVEHDVGFCRFCYVMLIPCALWDAFCHWWMVFMAFVLALVYQADTKGWNRRAEQNRLLVGESMDRMTHQAEQALEGGAANA